MPHAKPYRRTCRQFVDGSYAEGGRSQYIQHPLYAVAPLQYIRAFLLLQQDLHRLFEYIEPADNNLEVYSYRTHELLLRSCVEVEANCKAILVENRYHKSGELGMADYRKLDATHRLSDYEVIAPVWHGSKGVRRPFAAWATGGSLPWYSAYNATKHDRHSEFHLATFGDVVDAVTGLLVMLSAQFHTHDFAPVNYLIAEGPDDVGVGGYFIVRFPTFPIADRYDFDWPSLATAPDPFGALSFP
jgi:hypothetical protein